MYTLVGKCFKYTDNSVPSHSISQGKVEGHNNAIEWAESEARAIAFKKTKEWGKAYVVACLYHNEFPLTMLHIKSDPSEFTVTKFNMVLGNG
jgi:hypothetical protein